MIIIAHGAEASDLSTNVKLRCPACKRDGTFDAISGMRDMRVSTNGPAASQAVHTLAQRRCPNEGCRAHVFVVVREGKVVRSYPPELIDFDSTNIPARVVAALQEALTCHSNRCFVAAAILVRKTLEELCKDRGAGGDSLKKRIKALGDQVILSKDLLDAMDELRILGNDAAHLESFDYATIGQDELEVAIAMTKEILKAVYQHVELLNKIRALKKPKT